MYPLNNAAFCIASRRPLQPGETFYESVELTAKTAGVRELIACVTSRQLATITGSARIEVVNWTKTILWCDIVQMTSARSNDHHNSRDGKTSIEWLRILAIYGVQIFNNFCILCLILNKPSFKIRLGYDQFRDTSIVPIGIISKHFTAMGVKYLHIYLHVQFAH